MDADMDEPNFQLEISLDLASSDNEFHKVDENFEEDNELTNFVAKLNDQNMNFCQESNQFIVAPQSVADNNPTAPAPPKQKMNSRRKTKRFGDCQEEDCDDFANDSVEHSTLKQTTWAVKIFKGEYDRAI